jgi:general stress protein YciG
MVQGGVKESFQTDRHKREDCGSSCGGQVGLLGGHTPRFVAEKEDHQKDQVAPFRRGTVMSILALASELMQRTLPVA